MSRKSKSKKSGSATTASKAGPSSTRVWILIPLIAIFALPVLWILKSKTASPAPVAVEPARVQATNSTGNPQIIPLDAAIAEANPGFQKLKGQWLRPDGGYIVDIRDVDATGKLDASYSNPRPIHVAKAQASQEGALTKVFIELRDVNYPGSTYTLSYDPQRDQLTGIYYQAAMKEQFEVAFVRSR